MNKLETFQEFLATQGAEISVWAFVLNLVVAALLSYILSLLYVRYGNTLSNRNIFAKNFVMMTMTTMFIITVVKSSLALSLGLVGALSIVRFRAAIKEPEELSYLFLTIAIGLGLGADQLLITVVAFIVIVAIIVFSHAANNEENAQNLHLTVSTNNKDNLGLDSIIEVLNKHCTVVNLKRFDETSEMFEASFLVEFGDIEQLNKSKAELQKLNDTVKITFLDTKSIMSY
ncbi:MAG: DUF4956 domain-containing protein [Bacteroidetes bacterium]|nr:MAG: DUF4956 domain-containing protein [Bacteroidota bacterium]